jgi:hypothetical protein
MAHQSLSEAQLLPGGAPDGSRDGVCAVLAVGVVGDLVVLEPEELELVDDLGVIGQVMKLLCTRFCRLR